MGYVTGSVGSSDYPQKYIAGLETEMLSVGWVFVEEVVVGTYLHRVWKNPATLNRENKDFYVILRRLATPTGTATSVWLCAGREYKTSATPANITLRVGYGYSFASQALYLSENATGRDLSLASLPWLNSPITSTSIWWATVTKNYIATFTTENGEVCYAGLYLVYDHYRGQVQALGLEDIFIPVCSVDLPDGYPVFDNTGSNKIMNAGALPGYTGEYADYANWQYYYVALLPSERQIINPSQPGTLEEHYPFSYWEIHGGGQGLYDYAYENRETPAVPIGRLDGVGSCYFPSAVVRGDTVHVEDPASGTTETYVVTQSLSSGTYACISTGTLLSI